VEAQAGNADRFPAGWHVGGPPGRIPIWRGSEPWIERKQVSGPVRRRDRHGLSWSIPAGERSL